MARLRYVYTRLAAVVLVACLPALDAVAQPQGEAIEEVVVTATKTPGLALRDSPIAASSLGAELLEALRIDSVTDLTRALPGVQVQRLGQVGGLFLTIRGIASNPFVVNRVAVYVDDVPYRELNELLLDDLARVDLLRGPQSSLYGLNPEAGALVIRTRRPTDEAEFSARVGVEGYASSGSVTRGRLTASGPLADRLTGRFSVAGSTGDAFTRNLGASDGEEGALDEVAARGQLRFAFGDAGSLTAIAGYERLDAPGLYEQEFLPVDRERYNALYADSFNGGRRLGAYELLHDSRKFTREENVNGALRLEWPIGDARLTAVTSYREERDESAGVDLDLTLLPLFRGADRDREELFAQELRLTSGADADLKWLLGASYFDERDTQILATQDLAGGAAVLTPASEQAREGEDLAVFGQAVLPFFDGGARLTLGGRYERADRSSEQARQTFELPTGSFVIPAVSLSESFQEFLPKVALAVDLDEHWMLYASAARGWLPGGFNLAAVNENVERSLVAFDSETLWSYEVGAKLRTADGRLQASAAAFRIDVDNWQEFSLATTPAGAAASTTVVTSDSRVRSQGLEGELRWLPTPTLDVAFGAAWTDSEYRRYDFAPGIDYAGNRPPFAPEYELRARGEWRPTQRLALRAGITVQGDTALNADNSVQQDAYAIADLGGELPARALDRDALRGQRH